LFDANLSPKLVGRLYELFPGSLHVFDTGLARSTPDETIWEYAELEQSEQPVLIIRNA
jgi:predicted nuclease of predicted toxin-antitoxin system